MLGGMSKSYRPSYRANANYEPVEGDTLGNPVYAQVSFQLFNEHARILHEAVKKSGKNRSEYIRDIVIPFAASDIGAEVDMDGYGADPIAKLAKEAGMTKPQYMRWAAQQFAREQMRKKAPNTGVVRGANESGEQRLELSFSEDEK